ncbi:membrane protein [Gordonia phage Matteo]|uniref:Membrane protein n=1 Tax=Gordonia phage Matteo TaxID=2759392 RepID=A0A7L7STC7_9CAUD|nr:membrane protein [Gordonia phage Matteo]QOC55959.1 membrane protein [Gordonia phage Matteo]
MTQQPPPGWQYPDPDAVRAARAKATRQRLIIFGSIGVLVVVVLVALVVAGNLAGGSDSERAATSITETTEPHPTSAAGLPIAARRWCGAAVRVDWIREPNSTGDPQLVTPWKVTAVDPAGSTPGASWRLQGEYAVEKVVSGGRRTMSWDQTYFCDLEYVDGEFRARLV